jgi:hypothetical protein
MTTGLTALLGQPLSIEEGIMQVPSSPGFGQVTDDVVERMRVRAAEYV